jgi:hypothetical protein
MDATKLCRACREVKPLDDFYAHPAGAHGRDSICKVCLKARMKKRRREDPAVQEYDRARDKTPERKARVRAVVVKWRKDNPEGYRAHTAVEYALRTGRLVKGPCEVCGDPKVHGHHDDYSKPLDVRWLCALHHHRFHAEEEVVGMPVDPAQASGAP